MNSRDLEYFVRLAEVHSFTAVAKYFAVSQPTITYAIKRLEGLFETELFVKDPAHRAVVLTEQGEILAQHARKALAELDVAKKAIARANHQEICIGFPPIIRARILAQLLEQDKDLHFLSDLTFDRAGSVDLLEHLLAGELDFSLIGSLQALDHPQLISQELYQHPFYILLSEQHPLAGEAELSFGQLLDQPFILLGEGHVHRAAFNQLNSRFQDQARPFIELSELATIVQLVQKNVGISLLTDVEYMTEMAGLVKVPLREEERLFFHVSYAYRRESLLPPALETFKDLLEEMG